jgi:hypothetical protein
MKHVLIALACAAALGTSAAALAAGPAGPSTQIYFSLKATGKTTAAGTFALLGETPDKGTASGSFTPVGNPPFKVVGTNVAVGANGTIHARFVASVIPLTPPSAKAPPALVTGSGTWTITSATGSYAGWRGKHGTTSYVFDYRTGANTVSEFLP